MGKREPGSGLVLTVICFAAVSVVGILIGAGNRASESDQQTGSRLTTLSIVVSIVVICWASIALANHGFSRYPKYRVALVSAIVLMVATFILSLAVRTHKEQQDDLFGYQPELPSGYKLSSSKDDPIGNLDDDDKKSENPRRKP